MAWEGREPHKYSIAAGVGRMFSPDPQAEKQSSFVDRSLDMLQSFEDLLAGAQIGRSLRLQRSNVEDTSAESGPGGPWPLHMNDEVSQSPFDLAPPTNVITVQIVDSDAEALRNSITQVLFGQSVADLRRLAGVLRVSNYKTLNKTGLVRSLVGGHDHHHLMQFLLDKGF